METPTAETTGRIPPSKFRMKCVRGCKFGIMPQSFQPHCVSPHFLFLRKKPGKLDDFALASRLSYFLWSSMPDEQLMTLAEQDMLSQPETLREQVERMLHDPKAAAFTENFAGQWLGSRAIDATMPDSMLYPEFDDILKVAFSANKAHCNFAPTAAVLEAFRKQLKEHKTTKNYLQIPYNKPMPEDLVREIAEYRLQNMGESDSFW